MKKKLKVEELSVESFAVSAETTAEVARGTVRAFAKPTQQATLCQWTCVQDQCQPTFGYSCVETNCCCFELTR